MLRIPAAMAVRFIARMRAQPRIPIMPPSPHDGHYPVFVKDKAYREAELADHVGAAKKPAKISHKEDW